MENKTTITDKIKMILEDFNLRRKHQKFLNAQIMKDWQVVWGLERDRKMIVRAIDILKSEIKSKTLLIEDEKAKPKIDMESIKALEEQKKMTEEESRRYDHLDMKTNADMAQARGRILATREFMSQLIYKRDKCRMCGGMIDLNKDQVVWPEFANFQSCHFSCAAKKEAEIDKKRAEEKEKNLEAEREKIKEDLAELQSEGDK